MNKTNKIIVSIALTLVLCTGAALLAQAFFQAFTKDVTGNVTVTPPEKVDGSTVYVKVATEADLIKATKDEIYNSPEDISDDTKRVIILLTEDITLTQDLLITRDCHLDLGSKTLDTGDHTITVYHTYTGAYVIANGTLNGTINVNTPNAAVLIDEDSVNKDALTANVTAASAEAVRNAALSMVAAHLTNVLDDHGIYGMLTAGCTLPDFTAIYGCAHQNGCCFLAEDPDLPYWFFGYDGLKFTYETTAADGVETLSATVTYDGASTTQDFIIHKVTTAEEQSKAAAAIVLKELSPFYVEASGEYNFSTPVLLPSKVALGQTTNVEMTYTTTAGTLSGNKYSPAESDGNLTINGSTTVDTSGSISEVEETDYTRANRVIKELFGGGIVIQKEINSGVVSYTEQSLAYDPADFPAEYEISEITFALINNDEFGDYEIKDGVLRVRKNAAGDTYEGAPEEHSLVKVFLQATVLMHKDTANEVAITISIPITCKDVQDPGGQVAQFLPYYYFFNRMFTEVTSGNYTYTTFRMPTQYVSGNPQITFYVVDPNTANADGGYTFIDATTQTTYSFLTVAKDGDEWVFTIDPEKIGLTDQEVIFGYGYKFSDDSGYEIFSYKDGAAGKYSKLVVPGVVNKGNVDTEGFGDIPNPALYEFIYKIYHSEDETYEAATDYILASRLTHEVNLKADATSDGWADTDNIVLNFEGKQATFVTPVADEDYDPFEGLELLDNALSINLANSGITVDEFQYVAGMENLQYLNLANNGYTDGNGFNVNTDIIAPLTGLANLKELHLENNTIYDFSSLSDFASLEKAYVYGNSPSVSVGWAFLDNILTGVVRQIYGSTGAINTATFATMYPGTTIYNKNQTTPFAPADDAASEYSAFNNIEYQNKLPIGADISQIWKASNIVIEDLAVTNYVPSEVDANPYNPSTYGIAFKSESAYTYVDGAQTNNAYGFANYITFEIPAGTTLQTAESFILVYHNFVAETPSGWGQQKLGFSFEVRYEFPVERIPAENNN